MNNLINPLALRKVLKKYNISHKNREQIVFLSKRENSTWSSTHRLTRKLEFQKLVVVDYKHQK